MARKLKTLDDSLREVRNKYLRTLDDAVLLTKGVGDSRHKEFRWEYRAFKKLVLARLPGREMLNGHTWKAPKI